MRKQYSKRFRDPASRKGPSYRPNFGRSYKTPRTE